MKGFFGEMSLSLVLIASLTTIAAARTTESALACGITEFSCPSGEINSPNMPSAYPPNVNCNYSVYASTESSMTFSFNYLNTEEDVDFVTISCPTNPDFVPKRYSGDALPVIPVVIPSCSRGLVNFISDANFVSGGFVLDFVCDDPVTATSTLAPPSGATETVTTSLSPPTACGVTEHTCQSGEITSPNFPDYYPPNLNCNYNVYASTESSMTFTFMYLDTEEDVDFVTISCPTNPDFVPKRYSGDSLPNPVLIPSCSRALVNFISDADFVEGGFRVDFVCDDPVTGTSTVATPSSTTQTVTPSLSPPTDCGETSFNGPFGVISSPSYPGSYSNDLSCDYYISASSSSSSIAIIFQAFDTEQCCDYVTITCPTNSSRPSVSFSGSTLPPPFTIPWCSKGAVNFNTSSAVVSTGFSLDYHISLGGCGETVYTGSHGYVSSPNYPNSYGNNQNCSNIIWASVKSSFSITFQNMNVEECCDFVELSCLDNAEYGARRFTGSSIPPKQDIPQCTQVLVWFYTDDSITQTGFNLEYLVTPM